MSAGGIGAYSERRMGRKGQPVRSWQRDGMRAQQSASLFASDGDTSRRAAMIESKGIPCSTRGG